MVASVVRHRRRSRLAWIGAVATAALLIGGGAVGYLRSTGASAAGHCTGTPVTVNIAAAPDNAPVLTRLAQEWTATKPTVDGRCVGVAVRSAQNGDVAAALGPGWDQQRDGQRPDVWAPDSSAWLLVAAGRPDAVGVLPTGAPPSLASSPVVLAMQRPMAQALGWPERPIGWSDLAATFAGGQGWAKLGHPEWGAFRLGMVDPTRATPGMFSVLTFLDLDNDGTMSNPELLGGLSLTQLATVSAEDTPALLRPFTQDDAVQQAPTTLAAAFPLLERDLAEYAANKPKVDLVPVYPKEGTTFADYPYAVLRASWVDPIRQHIAAAFLTYLGTPAARQVFAAAGYRDANRATPETPLLASARGFQRTVQVPARTATSDGLQQLLGMWSVLQRPNNALVVLDTSGSMKDPVPGTNLTRLQLVQGAATQGASLLNNQTSLGLWEFSSKLTPTTDWRELVPLGKAGDKIGPVTRRQALLGAIQGLQINKGTGLYDSVLAAYQHMQDAWQPNAQNVLVIMTDGKNEDDEGLDLAGVVERLRGISRADRPLPIIALAVGPEADAGPLQQICAVTGGRTFVARDEVSAIQQIVLAFAGRLS
jgi:Ca-activated chloride channel family protein